MSLQNLNDIGLSSTYIKDFVYQMPIINVKKESFINNLIVEYVEISDAQSIEPGTFEGCRSLRELILPGITEYSDKIFGSSKPQLLTKVTINEGTTEIGTLLSGIRSVTDIILPQSLVHLSAGALDYCTKLSNLIISDKCEFSEHQFKYANSLTSLNIRLPINNKNLDLSGLYNNSSLSVFLDNPVTLLNKELFSGSGCSSITFSSDHFYAIYGIDNGAFQKCNNLISIDLSEQNIQAIPENAFKDCIQLSILCLPESIRSLQKNCFSGCNQLSISLPNQLTSIDYLGKQLEDVNIPSTLQIIGPSSFYYASFSDRSAQLTDLYSAGEYAFYNSEIQNAKFGELLTSINSYMFMNSMLSSFDFSFIKEVGKMSFRNTQLSSSPESIIALDSIEKYGDKAFSGINKDLYLTMSPEITSLGNFVSGVFDGSNIKEIQLTGLTNSQFNNLSDIAGGSLIPASKSADDIKIVYKRIKNMFGSNTDFVFELSDISFDKDGSLADYDCFIYSDTEKKHLIKCDKTKSDYAQFISTPILPARVTTIGPASFQNLIELTAINIKNVITIDNDAFNSCSNLRSLTCDNVRHIGENSFKECAALTSINAPYLTDIGQLAFFNCYSIQNFNAPELKLAGSNAFYSCKSLMSVILPELTSVNPLLFSGCDKLENAYIPKAESVGQYSFESCTSLTSATITNSKFIGEKAFFNCSSLKMISLPALLTSIGSYPFASCNKLEAIQINGPVNNIPSKIAAGIPNILSIYIPHSTLNDVKFSLSTNRFETRVHSQFFTSDKRSIYPSLITKSTNEVIDIENGLIVDADTFNVISADNSYNLKFLYESDLNKLNGINNNAFQNSKIQIVQLPISWGSSSEKWNKIGTNIFNGSLVQYVRVMRKYDASTAPYDNALYTKLFSMCTTFPYIRFDNGSLVSSSKFVSDTDPFIYDSTGEWIVGVNDENVSATGGGATVKNIVNGISSYAFESSRFLNILTIADRTEFSRTLSIMDDAFSGADRLSTIIFESASQLSIFDNAFRGSYIRALKLPNFLSVGGYGLQDSNKLRYLEYSNETLQILPSAMIDCKPLLHTVEFGTGLTGIGDYAFAEIEDPFPNIEYVNFYDCNNLKSIGKYAFYNSIQSTHDGKLVFPNSITSISDAAFAYRKGYKEYHKISALDLHSSNIKDIGPSAFYYNSFKEVIFGDNLSSIGQYAFAKSTYKYDVYIPNSISNIGWKSFKDNIILNPDNLRHNVMSVDTSLENLSTIIGLDSKNPLLSINDKFQAVTNTIGISRNTILSALRSHYLSGFIIASAPDSNPRNSLLNFCPSNMKIDIMNRKIVRCDNSLNYAYIPNYITSAAPSAFMNCTNINMLCDFYDNPVYMLNNVEDYQFYGCSNLSNIYILSTATHIGNFAFSGCNQISSIYGEVNDEKFPYYKLESIGSCAFMNCSSLKKFDMCNSVSSIGVKMFDNCPSLKNIFIDMTTDNFNFRFAPFPDSTLKKTIIYYFSGIAPGAACKINFRDAIYTNDGNVWLDTNLVRLRQYGKKGQLSAISGLVYDSEGRPLSGQTYLNLSSVSMIDKYVFDGITTLKNINLIENETTHVYLSSIGEYAFYNCQKLNSINGNQLSCTDVGQYAFGKCKLLLDMQFDLSKLLCIGKGAFYKTNLANLTFIDPSRSDINTAREAIIKIIGFDSSGDRNPLQLPDGCMINVKLNDGSSYQFNYLLDDLSSTVVDINRHTIVFTDKTTTTIKPLVLIESTNQDSVPAIVANTFHANIIGRWK